MSVPRLFPVPSMPFGPSLVRIMRFLYTLPYILCEGVKGPCGFGYSQCSLLNQQLDANLQDFYSHVLQTEEGVLCGATGAGLRALVTGGVMSMGINSIIGCVESQLPTDMDACDDFTGALSILTHAIARFFCQAYGRGVGTIPGCKSGQTKSGLLCYPNCKSGYYAVGPVCWEHCPSGYHDAGAICAKSFFHWFFKHSYGNGAGYPLNHCADGKEMDAGLCYPPCKQGYHGVGPVCWPTFGAP